MTTIVQALAEDELADVRRLMQAFASWRRNRMGDDVLLSKHSAEDGGLESGLAELPGPFAPPRGRLLVPYETDQPAGLASLCELDEGVCEVAWIFVSPPFRGQRVGRALVERLLLEAKAAGYQRMRLATSIHEDEALRLCERAGFHRIDVTQEAPGRSCQTNANWSHFRQERPISGGAERPPLGKSGGAVHLVDWVLISAES